MVTLISDGNIINDMIAANLIRPMFRLKDEFATHNVLYQEELAQEYPELPALGLRIERLSGTCVAEVERLVEIYSEPSINELFALALAGERQWPLLSDDHRLCVAASAEDVEINGTVWIIERLLQAKAIDPDRAEAAVDLWKRADRRLPWSEFDTMIERVRKGGSND